MIPEHKLNAEDVRGMMLDVMEKHLSVKKEGNRSTKDESFYGKTPELLTYTCKTRAQTGTMHFFRIASAYIIWREVRLTLALTYVLPEDDLLGMVARLALVDTRVRDPKTKPDASPSLPQIPSAFRD